jgi:hypothetical protein
VIESIPVGGFTGTIAVPTLASSLGDMLAAKESPFNANLLAKGAVTPAGDASDFAALAQEHCTEYAASQGCDNPAGVAAQFVAQYLAWLKSQPASAYQSGDRGSLFSPTAAPVSSPVTTPNPVSVSVGGQGQPIAAPVTGGNSLSPVGAPAPVVPGILPASSPNTAGAPGQGGGFLDQTFSVFGQSFPVWGALAAGVAGLYFLGGRH